MAAVPEASVWAAAPPSRAAMRFASTSFVGFSLAGGVGLTALPGDGVGEDGEGLREIHVLHDDALGDGKLG